ncbi:MAG: hypothetical protein IPN20_23700 [Haliscomenobacter sp.]|nr:hypothetical protein [Haliscomenobacter sp.]
MLDALSGSKDRLAAYRQLFRAYQSNKRRLDQLDQLRSRSNKESEFLAFQLEELQAAGLQSGGQEGLEAELTALAHAEEIKKRQAGLCSVDQSEQSLVGRLQHTGYLLGQVSRFDARMARAPGAARLGDPRLPGTWAPTWKKWPKTRTDDPGRIRQMQARLDLIYRLQKNVASLPSGSCLTSRDRSKRN